MYPLIEIKTVPIEIEMKTTNATWEYRRGTAEMEIRREKGGLKINSRPIRVQMDTFEARNSVSPTPMRSVEQSAQRGRQAAYEATAAYARHGKLLLNAKVGEDVVTQIATEPQQEAMNVTVNLDFLPKGGVEMDWQAGEMQIRYEMDKLNFDWKVDNASFEFVPADIEISVAQMPDVIIKYVGGPLYVPPSADPDYQPVDVQA
ncbi:MAG: hypothetical protein HFJ96_08050 [Peptococcaceae bacterium]|jgi:hypothetical protein|nr:hypothetical protein [Peptococcaceae bacterium]